MFAIIDTMEAPNVIPLPEASTEKEAEGMAVELFNLRGDIVADYEELTDSLGVSQWFNVVELKWCSGIIETPAV